MKPPHLGKQPPRFRFFLNPYSDVRFSSCPECQSKTRLRKLPLAIHVRPHDTMLLNKTCRYCPACDLLIAHQDEIEPLVRLAFEIGSPDDFLVFGTVDRPDWRAGVKGEIPSNELPDHLHDFREIPHFKLVGGWLPR